MQSNNIRVMASIKRSVSSLGLLKTSRSASYTNFALTVVYAGSTVYWSQNNNFMVDTYVNETGLITEGSSLFIQ